MNEKRFLLLGLLAFILLIGFVSAQVGSVKQEELESDAGKIQNASDQLQGIVEGGQNWTYLGGEWKKILLKNEVVSKFDAGFKKINFVFLFLFGRNYDISLTLFFVFLMWIFTALSLEGYLGGVHFFAENKTYGTIAAFAITIILAQMQIFNYISKGMFKIIFYRAPWWWSLIFGVIMIVAIVFYFYLNRIFATAIKKNHEEAEKKKAQQELERVKKSQEGLWEGIR